MNHATVTDNESLDVFDYKDWDVLAENDIEIHVECEETWLVPEFVQNEDCELYKKSNGSTAEFRPQISVSKSGQESKRQARFKTQVIEYKESLGDADDIDLEPPPSFSSLDDFVPDKLSTTATIKTNDPINTNGVGSLTPNTAVLFKSSVLDRIQAIKLKYATPKPVDDEIVTTPDFYDDESIGSPILNKTFEDNQMKKLLNLSLEEESAKEPFLLNKTFEEVPINKTSLSNRTFEEGPNKPSSLNRTSEDVPNTPSLLNRTFEEVPNKPSLLNRTFEEVSNKPSFLNRTFEEVPNKPSSLNRTFEEVPNKPSLLNRTFEDMPMNKRFSLNRTVEEISTNKRPSLNRTIEDVPSNRTSILSRTFEDIQPNKLSLMNKRVEEVQNNKLSLQRKLEEFCPNKLSQMNNNLFVATCPTPGIEISRSMTNIHEQVEEPKPKLKKQGTFEILDNIDDDSDKSDSKDVGGDEDGRYQTMVLNHRNSGSTNGSFGKEFAPHVSISSTPNIKSLKSRTQTMQYQERKMNTSFTIEKHEDFKSVTYLNGNAHSGSPEEDLDHMNRSFVVRRYPDAEELSEAASTEEFNANEAHMNQMNESNNLLNCHEDISRADLNASFTVKNHYETHETRTYNYASSGHNTSDINDNIVNGKVVQPKANNVVNNSYPTFTRPKKPTSAPGGTYRNGTSGLQKKSIMKPTPAGNLNTTYCSDPAANVNETANTKHMNPSRFSTITRPKSKLSYVGQTKRPPSSSTHLRLKNSSSTESLKSNESYVISRPNGLRAPSMVNKRSIYKSTGALNLPGPRTMDYGKVQSTENLSVKSGGSDSEGSNPGSSIPRPQSGLLKPGFSRIPAPASRISTAYSSKTSMLQKYTATRRV